MHSTPTEICLASARHHARATITPDQHLGKWLVELPSGLLQQELARSFPSLPRKDRSFVVDDHPFLALLLRRTAELALSLPHHAAQIFADKMNRELADRVAFDTEVERLIRQRVGQDIFRQALLDYWQGSCAVTGIDLPEILRASHAKPWADCETDEERLNVYNGFLLSANLDALFDRGLISFAEDGQLICSSCFTTQHRSLLQLDDQQKLRWITSAHQPFLHWHRGRVFLG